MNIKKIILNISISAVILGVFTSTSFAAAPVQPNCGGQDASNFAQNGSVFFGPDSEFGKFHSFYSTNFGPGFDSAVLSHLQGIPVNSSCPDNGFPTPVH